MRHMTITFDRLGRTPPSKVEALVLPDTEPAGEMSFGYWDEIAGEIEKHARRYLMSREVRVQLGKNEATGEFAGWVLVGEAGTRIAGEFTIARQEQPA